METMTETGGVIPHHHHSMPGSSYFPQKDTSPPSTYFFPKNSSGGSNQPSSSIYHGYGSGVGGGEQRGEEGRESDDRRGGDDSRRNSQGGGSDRYHLPSSHYSSLASSSTSSSSLMSSSSSSKAGGVTSAPYPRHPHHHQLQQSPQRGMNPFLHHQLQQRMSDEDKNKLPDPAMISPDKRSLGKDGTQFSPKKGMGMSLPYDTNAMMSPFFYNRSKAGGRNPGGFMPEGRHIGGSYDTSSPHYMSDVRESVKEVYDSFLQGRGMNSGGKDGSGSGKIPEAIPVAYDDADAQSEQQQQMYREKLERSISQDTAAMAARNNNLMANQEYGHHRQIYESGNGGDGGSDQQRPRAITMNSMYSRRDNPSSFPGNSPYSRGNTNIPNSDLYNKMREHFNRSEAAMKNHYYFMDKDKEIEERARGGAGGPDPMSPNSSTYIGGSKHQRRPSGDTRSLHGRQDPSVNRMMMMMSPNSGADRMHPQMDRRQGYPEMHQHHPHRPQHLQHQHPGMDPQHTSIVPPSSYHQRKSLDSAETEDHQVSPGVGHSNTHKSPISSATPDSKHWPDSGSNPTTPNLTTPAKERASSEDSQATEPNSLSNDGEICTDAKISASSNDPNTENENRKEKDATKEEGDNTELTKDLSKRESILNNLSTKEDEEGDGNAEIRKRSSESLDDDNTSLPDALPRELLPPKKELLSEGEDDSFHGSSAPTFPPMTPPSPSHSHSSSGIPPSGYPSAFPPQTDRHAHLHHQQQSPQQHLPQHQQPFFHSPDRLSGRMPQPPFGNPRALQEGAPGMSPAFPFNKDMTGRFPMPGLPRDMGMGPAAPGFMGGPLPPLMNSDAEKDVYFCHLCSYSGKSKPDFDLHMGIHFEYNCPHCDYTSRTEGRLKRHIKDFHTDENGRRSMPGRPKVFKCKQCSFSATEKDKFWEHARSHIKEDKLLQCPKCPFVTEYKHHLEYHLRNHFGSKPFKCNKCNYSCVNKSMLNSHMKSHTNVYQYRCSDCTYATKYCHSLKLHLRKYNHKPATVLNQDGSLPQGADVDASGLSVNTKRGPPRGPRGPRKEKNDPYFNQMFGGGIPPMPMGIPPGMNPILKGMMPFWPVVPPSGIPGHPGMLPGLPNMPPSHMAMRGSGERDRDDMRSGGERNSSGSGVDRSSDPEMNGMMSGEDSPMKDDDEVMYLPCRLCEFVAEGTEALCLHLIQAHKDETGEMASMYGLSESALAESLERARKNKLNKMDIGLVRRMSEMSNDSEIDMSEFKRRNTIAGLLSRDAVNFGRGLNTDKSFWPGGFGRRDRSSLDESRMHDLCYVDDGNDDGDNENESSGGMDILQQMTLKFGGGGSGGVGGNNHTERSMSLDADLIRSGEDDREREQESTHDEHDMHTRDRKPHGQKETPLDLTKPKSASPSIFSNPSSPRRFDEFNSEDDEMRSSWMENGQGSELDKVTENLVRKRQFSDVDEINSYPEFSASGSMINATATSTPDPSRIVPRKRARKGKAYKLETLCLKLQERHSRSPNDSDENDAENESNDLDSYQTPVMSERDGDIVDTEDKMMDSELNKEKNDTAIDDLDNDQFEKETDENVDALLKIERGEDDKDADGNEGKAMENETKNENVDGEKNELDSYVKDEPFEEGDKKEKDDDNENNDEEKSSDGDDKEGKPIVKKEKESEAADNSFEKLQEAINDLSKDVTEEDGEKEEDGMQKSDEEPSSSKSPNDESLKIKKDDDKYDDVRNMELIDKRPSYDERNIDDNVNDGDDDDDAKTEILGEDLSMTKDNLFDLSDKENSTDGFGCFDNNNPGSPSNKLPSDEVQIEDKVDMINTVLENRKKPLPPAVRRGTELAWKLLNDPVNPVTSIPIPVVSPPAPEWKTPSQPRPPSPMMMSPLGPNSHAPSSSSMPTSHPPHPHPHPTYPLPLSTSGPAPGSITAGSPIKNGMRTNHPFHQSGLPPSPSINMNMKPHLPIPLPPTPMAFIPPTNRMMPEHSMPRPPPPQVPPPPPAPPTKSSKDMYECTYCDLSFRDCVMYTVHMGYHSNRNPFKCNSCGTISRDKVEFFLHIARSPHS